MRLTVFNGSPRATKGNTEILIGDLIRGFTKVSGNSAEIQYLNTETRRREAARAFAESETALLCFPLYHHGMPGIVMTWLEMLKPPDPDRNVALGFLVQSGLPEACQSRAVEQFLARLPMRLGCTEAGVLIRGGVEAMRFAPDLMFRRMHRTLTDLGRELATTGRFDPRTITLLSGREVLPWWRLAFFRAMKAVGFADKSWNDLLKRNGAWAERFDRPYAPFN